jgi:excinuclease ABC subunit B
MAIMYADNVTKSMQKTIDETQYRREKQLAYNAKHNITPKALNKSLETVFDYEQTTQPLTQAAEPDLEYLTKDQLKTKIRETRKSMETAAKALDFMEAARLRDLIQEFQKHLSNKK